MINDEVLQAQQQQQMNSQRSRMPPPPPPGFNHLQQSGFGNYGVPAASPRTQSKLIILFKKILLIFCVYLAGSKFPFVNMQNGTNPPPPPPQQNNWPMHMNFQNNSDGFSHQPSSQLKAGGKSF